MGPDKPSTPFSNRVFAAPFGRYQSGSESGAGANDVLVGREEQRSYFIELLLRMERRGAYLVTGRRGIGKTSFVNYCLGEYKAEVFERFLRSGVGRAFFWDHAGVLLLLLGIIFALLMVSELMELLTLSTGWGKGDRPNVLFGLIILPLVLICMYPLLHARELVGTLVQHVKPAWARYRGAIATGVIAVIALWVFFFPPFGSPALSMSRLFLALCAMYLAVQSVSYNFDEKPRYGIVLALWLVIFSSPWWGPQVVAQKVWLRVQSHQEFAGNFLLGVILLGGGSLLRGLHLSLIKDKSGRAVGVPFAWYFLIGILLSLVVPGLVAAPFLLSQEGPWYKGWVNEVPQEMLVAALLCLVAAFGLFSLSRWLGRKEGAVVSFRPQPSLILGAKALLSVVVTLQLIHPIFDKWTPARITASHEDAPVEVPSPLINRCADEIAAAAATNLCAGGPWREQGQGRGLRAPQRLFAITSLSEREHAGRKLLREAEEELEHLRLLGPKSIVDEKRQEIIIYENRVKDILKKEAAAGQRRDSAVFYGRLEEIAWIMGLLLCLIVVYFMEYEWILRPFLREREDGALNLAGSAPWHDREPLQEKPGRESHRSLVRLTLPWILFDRWLPILTVGVNLGFEKLDHRRVVHAMLAGLRDQYHRAFQAWDSGFANLGRLLGFLLVMMLVTLAGDHWFGLPKLPLKLDDTTFAQNDYQKICTLFEGRQIGSGAANWICKLPGGDSTFHILNYNLLGTESLRFDSDRDLHLLFHVFPYREDRWPPVLPAGISAPLLEPGIHLRLYHVMLFVLFSVMGSWLLQRLPILPYREILNRIDDTMDSLASRTSVTSTMGRWKPAQWLQGFFLDERVRQTEQDPVDPRTVEFVFLQILRDIQNISYRLPGGRDQALSLPTPEIIFVLDELDKIGTRVDPDEIGSSGGAQQAEILDAERRRSMELHKLLADMKNLLSAAPARFIFVGGRNLHDEWLADQTARQPLLTNIFTAEIYLPSLLTDHGEPAGKSLSTQIDNYLKDHLRRANEAFRSAGEKGWSPWAGLPLEEPGREAFAQRRETKPAEGKDDDKGQNGTDGGGGSPFKILDVRFLGDKFPGDELKTDFVQFLAYRSMGNSKKLKELLGTFVKSANRAVQANERRWDKDFRGCDHVLYFGDTERFRIQLLARVYRHLTAHFEQELVRRDDKLALSVLFLTDFLFKFHRRGFSWSNLERVDDLVHIHRAPDLREILEAIVVQWSERFLHPIRNGMYDFRFRSDMAREIEYISRQSADEMAAFNFTLDESQALKSAYETNIARLRTENREDLQDLVAGLGELHEFDQEYEAARLHYRRAISLLDQELEGIVGGSELLSNSSARIEIIGGEVGGLENARRHMTWGVARLRLMLQIGMTFEHGRNLERAQMEYQNARTLARSLLLAMLDKDGRTAATQLGIMPPQESASSVDRLHALKHLNILFQPMFAEAWVAEKLTGGVDTSTTLTEQELWHLRKVLPFLREPTPGLSESGVEAQNSNFALIGTEIHNKAGDLYFFKGRQLVPIDSLKDFLSQERKGSMGYEGYLLRAHYHYAVGLHELRRFITHRKESSRKKLNVYSTREKWETIASAGWPDFVFRAVGGGFNDLADALLGRISLVGVFQELWRSNTKPGPRVGQDVDSLFRECIRWLESSEDLGNLKSWLGEWRLDWDSKEPRLVEFLGLEKHDDLTTLLTSLRFTMVGARFLSAGGYLEDAGRELLKVCESVNHLLWSAYTMHRLACRCEGFPDRWKFPDGTWSRLCNMALRALDKAGQLFLRSRRAEDGKSTSYRVGTKIPIAAMTQACSLGLISCRLGESGHLNELLALLKEWTEHSELEGLKNPSLDTVAHALRRMLEESLVRHSYPMINRLHTLRILVDDGVLAGGGMAGPDHACELVGLSESLNAPLHFTPLHLGTTCALVYLFSGKDAPFCDAAERYLSSSQEMYTMRRSFYENISDLYYLYDDFNDRQLHFNHAIQMAGAEMSTLLRHLVYMKKRGKIRI